MSDTWGMDTRTENLSHTPASLRALRGLSIKELAKAAKVDVRTVTSIESGGKSVRVSSLVGVARALNVSLTNLVAACERVGKRRAS